MFHEADIMETRYFLGIESIDDKGLAGEAARTELKRLTKCRQMRQSFDQHRLQLSSECEKIIPP